MGDSLKRLIFAGIEFVFDYPTDRVDFLARIY